MNIHEAALAGLLHDIGKLWQRAESSAQGSVPAGYEQYTRQDFGANGTYAAWSAAFIDRYVPKAFRQAIWPGVLFHHNPQDALARLVQLAAQLAASERERADAVAPNQLQSVFCALMGSALPAHYYPLRSLELTENTLFPSITPLPEADARHAYGRLWKQFVRDAETLQHVTDLPTYLEGMQAAMARTCWCVPSAAFRNVADISLYDHSRTTAALAAALAATYDDTEIQQMLTGRGNDNTPVLSLVEGDISGVQKFIYTITAKGAAKALRSRSFYLQVLSETAARMILREMDMPITNLLYVGGGHFYLLIPPKRGAELRRLREKLARFMLIHHDGDLYLALGERQVSVAELHEPDRFSKAWAGVGQATNIDKRRQYASLSPSEQMSMIFAPRFHDGTDELGQRRLEREENGDRERSNFSQSLHELGTMVHQAASIALISCDPVQREPGDLNAALSELGYQIALVDDHGGLIGRPPGAASFQRAVLLGMRAFPSHTARSALEQTFGCPVASGLRYTVNVIPHIAGGGVADFGDLQAVATGLKRLGVLRMDVDDLGQLFARGFVDDTGRPNATLSRVASLSFALSLYFEGWVGELAHKVNERGWRHVGYAGQTRAVQPIYTVYSGGDDLFIVGAWDELTGLADQIRRDLTRFACGNDQVHVSAGITLHGGKYPLYQAATDAERALESAKDVPGKNAVTFLEQSVTWEQWQLVGEIQKDLLELHQAHVPRSLFQMLMELYAEYQTARRAMHAQQTQNNQSQVVWGAWMWHSAYRIKRMADRHKDQGDQIMALQEDMQRDEFKGIRYVGIAARWADALTRTDTD